MTQPTQSRKKRGSATVDAFADAALQGAIEIAGEMLVAAGTGAAEVASSGAKALASVGGAAVEAAGEIVGGLIEP